MTQTVILAGDTGYTAPRLYIYDTNGSAAGSSSGYGLSEYASGLYKAGVENSVSGLYLGARLDGDGIVALASDFVSLSGTDGSVAIVGHPLLDDIEKDIASLRTYIESNVDNLYHADIQYIRGTVDKYLVTWFVDGEIITSGITSPTLIVMDEDGTELINTAMTAVGNYFKLETSTRQTLGNIYNVKATATYAGGTITYSWNMGRDT